jgi:hypothetical protein
MEDFMAENGKFAALSCYTTLSDSANTTNTIPKSLGKVPVIGVIEKELHGKLPDNLKRLPILNCIKNGPQ